MQGYNISGFGKFCYPEITHGRKHQEAKESMNRKKFLNTTASLPITEWQPATSTEFSGKWLHDHEMVLIHSAKKPNRLKHTLGLQEKLLRKRSEVGKEWSQSVFFQPGAQLWLNHTTLLHRLWTGLKVGEQKSSLRLWEADEAPASTAEEQHPTALPCKLLITESSPMISLQCRSILILTWCPRCRCMCQQNWWPAGLAQTLPSPSRCKCKITAGQQRKAHTDYINFSQVPSMFLQQIHVHSMTSTETF